MPPPGSPTRPKSTPKGKEAKASRTRAKRPENETAALVRYRNDGEEFHLIWTARRALRLLDDRFGLKQVVVEGVSREEETEGVTAGLLVVDTAEYFGDPVREVRYCQLKYSTRAASEPWTVSGLRETLEGFAKRFGKFAERDGAESAARRYHFEFVTNRPIAPAVCTAIEILGGRLLEAEPTKEVATARDALLAAMGLPKHLVPAFVRCLRLLGSEAPLIEQNELLAGEGARLQAEPDINASAALVEMVRRRGTSDGEAIRTITRETVLGTLGSSDIRELLPAPSSIIPPTIVQDREEFRRVAAEVLGARSPVLLRAPGGYGKSTLALSLPDLMPEGSAAVIYDGFNGGNYRSLTASRHDPGTAALQIANELAAKGLCLPLLPRPGAAPMAWMRSLRSRLEQAVASVRVRHQEALVLVVVDAGDNSEIAARERGLRSFAREFLLEAVPAGVRVVVAARPERCHLLDAPATVRRVDLKPFGSDESAAHLRVRFPTASDMACGEFHRLTSGNPRVQAAFITDAPSLDRLFALLGPNPLGADALIARQLADALERGKEAFGDPAAWHALLSGLATLPPAVPIAALARAADVLPEAVRSFVSDFAGGRPVLLVSDAVQFRDEPTETWFREHHLADQKGYGRLADALGPLAGTDSYAALAFPALLLGAGRGRDLRKLALETPPFGGTDAVARREVAHARATAALRAAVKERDWPATAMLLLRTAEDAANRERQMAFLAANADLVAALAGDDVVADFVFRGSGWRGGGHAHAAAMLAALPARRAEAVAYLRSAEAWLTEWSREAQLGGERRIEGPTDSAAASMVLASLDISGPDEAARDLARWRPASFRFRLAFLVADRLAAGGRHITVEQLLTSNEACNEMRVACAAALANAGQRVTQTAAQMGLTAALAVEEKGDSSPQDAMKARVARVSAVELAARSGLPREHLITAIGALLPPRPTRLVVSDPERLACDLRMLALKASLEGREPDSERLLPAPTSQPDKTGQRGREAEELRKAEDGITALLPLFVARAALISASADGPETRRKIAEAARVTAARLRRMDRDWDRRRFVEAAIDAAVDGLALAEPDAEEIKQPIVELGEVAAPSARTLAAAVQRLAAAGAEDAVFAVLAMAREATRVRDGTSETADILAFLARCLLPLSIRDAEIIFREANEAVSAIGEEFYARTGALLTVARHAAADGTAGQRDAQRLARAAEFLHRYNDHDFPWEEVAAALAGLSLPQAFAAASRWDDRDVVRLTRTLPALAGPALSAGPLDPRLLGVLHALSDDWDSNKVFTQTLRRATAPQRNSIIRLIADDLERSSSGQGSLGPLRDAAREFGLHMLLAPALPAEPRLELATPSFAPRKNMNSGVTDADRRVAAQSGDPLVGEGMEAILAAARQLARGEEEAVLAVVRSRLAVSNLPTHLQALSNAEGLNLYLLVRVLRSTQEEKGDRPVVAEAVRSVAGGMPAARPLEFAKSLWLIDDFASLASANPADLLPKVLEGVAIGPERAGADTLFRLAASVVVQLVTPSEATAVLRFALSRVEALIEDDFSEGGWQPSLAAPEHLDDLIAGLLYARLGDPRGAQRWRAVHAVRRAAALGMDGVLRALGGMLATDPSYTPFRSEEMVFYRLHSRLFLLIALARIAIERPDLIAPFATMLARIALDAAPHLLISTFAAQAAAAAGTGELPEETLRQLRDVGKPKMAPVLDTRRSWPRNRLSEMRAGAVCVPFDFDTYWIAPLGQAFGKGVDEVALLIGDGIAALGHPDISGEWQSDPRARHRLSRSEESSSSRGSHPGFERLSFYLSWHGLQAAGVRLLTDCSPISDQENRQPDAVRWVREQGLVSEDGTWLADFGRPIPSLLRSREARLLTSLWEGRAALLHAELDELLAGGDGEIVVFGSGWTVVGRRRERWSIQSSLVPARSAMALIRAAQTSLKLDLTFLPDNDRYETRPRSDPFRAVRVAEHRDRLYGLDDRDPFGGGLERPGPQPNRLLRRLLRLREASDGAGWADLNGRTVLSAARWGSFRQEEPFDPPRHGSRLAAPLDTLLPLLERFGASLVLRVEVERWDDSRERNWEEGYGRDIWCRFYAVGGDGKLRTHRGPAPSLGQPDPGRSTRPGEDGQ